VGDYLRAVSIKVAGVPLATEKGKTIKDKSGHLRARGDGVGEGQKV